MPVTGPNIDVAEILSKTVALVPNPLTVTPLANMKSAPPLRIISTSEGMVMLLLSLKLPPAKTRRLIPVANAFVTKKEESDVPSETAPNH